MPLVHEDLYRKAQFYTFSLLNRFLPGDAIKCQDFLDIFLDTERVLVLGVVLTPKTFRQQKAPIIELEASFILFRCRDATYATSVPADMTRGLHTHHSLT